MAIAGSIALPMSAIQGATMNTKSVLGLLTAALAWALTAPIAVAQIAPKYSAKVPPYITTPDQPILNLRSMEFR
jgi:hypothetical protein